MRLSLYCLAIETPSEHFYKIGVTARPIAERVSELQLALNPHVGAATITVLGVWPQRGHVERYAHFRHQAHRRTLGTFQEYFAFPDMKAVVRDFNRMPKKVLKALEQGVLAGAPSVVMQAIAAEKAAQDRMRNDSSRSR
ncbi:GIY-YIG nuclease family protein [Herpetosiphon gulosus]|uniref:GIY-YIG nuclease family protein n=1 Tax=Herpetosiphon gulosus TaxID=1973496 RepID=UPI0031EBA042